MILIDVKLHATATQRDAFIQLLEQTQRASQAEAGCVIYRFSVDLHDPLTFYLVELWQDEAALTAHFKGDAFAGFIAQLPQLGRVESSVARSGDLQPHQIKR
jgi:quinol monooxygenase YgiN